MWIPSPSPPNDFTPQTPSAFYWSFPLACKHIFRCKQTSRCSLSTLASFLCSLPKEALSLELSFLAVTLPPCQLFHKLLQSGSALTILSRWPVGYNLPNQCLFVSAFCWHLIQLLRGIWYSWTLCPLWDTFLLSFQDILLPWFFSSLWTYCASPGLCPYQSSVLYLHSLLQWFPASLPNFFLHEFYLISPHVLILKIFKLTRKLEE